MTRIILIASLVSMLIPTAWANAEIDPDVKTLFTPLNIKKTSSTKSSNVWTIVFLRKPEEQQQFVADIERIPGVKVNTLTSLPALLVSIPRDEKILQAIAQHPSAAQISSLPPGNEELENSEQAILLRPSDIYPSVSNWWAQGFTGKQGVIGLIDSGIAIEHPSLSGKTIILRKEAGSGYDTLKNGVRTAHGTGVACIYAGQGSSNFPNDIGIAYDASTIVAGLAGAGDNNFDDVGQTLNTLDWMLQRSNMMPTVINYSFGNGIVSCGNCTDWSGIARAVDYVVNHYKIIWVKSAGNGGYIQPTSQSPYPSTMTAPADNYNGITVANMNPAVMKNGTWVLYPDRSQHKVRYTSSRGPTMKGRKKPDISAPGNDTRTCAPDPNTYSFKYTPAMDYQNGYRLMGGTSSAAPHVGASLLLLQDSGITEPMAQKALLINSADAWTDSGKPGPEDPGFIYSGGHHPVEGSEWNRTYGWGYINMQKAFEQRHNLYMGELSLANPEQLFVVDLPVGAKITLVHERRVGYDKNYISWQLSHLSLKLMDTKTHEVIASDMSQIDTVHQVANCKRNPGEFVCLNTNKPIQAVVSVKLLSNSIDGSESEPFVLVMSVPFKNTEN